MTYEQKYKEALERARELYDLLIKEGTLSTPKGIEAIFPELRESDDERIRKELIAYLETKQLIPAETKNEWLAWLEKQELKSNPYSGVSFSCNGNTWGMCTRDNGVDILFNNKLIQHISGEMQGEQKTEIECIYPRFRIGDVIEPIKPNGFHRPVRVLSIEKKTKSYYCESDDKKSFLSIPIRCEDEYKLVEQKPSWSEEDEKRFEAITRILIGCDCAEKSLKIDGYSVADIAGWLKSLKPKTNQEWKEEDELMLKLCDEALFIKDNPLGVVRTPYDDAREWLKSLKPQPHWKPSEEQMSLLLAVINEPNNASSESCHISLKKLYDELKKL